MKIRFGLWMINLGLKIAHKGSDILGIPFDDLIEEDEDHNVSIYCVLDGPYTQGDLGAEWDGPYEAEAYLLVKLEYDGKVSDVEWYFETLDEAYIWVKHFKESIEPIVIKGRPDE